ncbi:VanZ family protein [Lacibacter sp.]|uniref:VanZ family protein n=1 Tax=Lacibacter sp. TaxID=1915409 RepID=UPI002B4B2B66|nr:VanZ family protein [Lacibacter sp.]HLP37393.1 VanZ family protein [Lacibacter sp.]
MKQQLRKYLNTKWPAIFWSVIIFLLLVMPPININQEKPLEFSGIDKAIHFLLFGIMVWLWGYYQKTISATRKNLVSQLLRITVIVMIYGIVMEYVQDWVGRDFDVWDMVADAAGAITGFILLLVQKEDPGGNRGRNQN